MEFARCNAHDNFSVDEFITPAIVRHRVQVIDRLSLGCRDHRSSPVWDGDSGSAGAVGDGIGEGNFDGDGGFGEAGGIEDGNGETGGTGGPPGVAGGGLEDGATGGVAGRGWRFLAG